MDELETKTEKPLSLELFYSRFFKYLFFASFLVLIALGIGMIGYSTFENMNIIDSFLNASMILGGMGPVDVLKTPEGKIFAGVYALFSGLMFMVISGLLFAPLFHRILHKFHFDEESLNK